MTVFGDVGLLGQVMLCITPNPEWMDPGDETPIGFGNPINETNEIYTGAKLHPVRGNQLHMLTGNQINAILKVRIALSAHFAVGELG